MLFSLLSSELWFYSVKTMPKLNAIGYVEISHIFKTSGNYVGDTLS